jgi:hypothetical protein
MPHPDGPTRGKTKGRRALQKRGRPERISMHGFLKTKAHRGQRHYRRRGRHFRNGQCAAALRANTAARILLGLPVSANNLATAARMCGSNIAYVAAAIALIRAEDASLDWRVRHGRIPLRKAAAGVKKRAALIKAYREAAPEDLTALVRAVGAERMFDQAITPALV